MTDGYTLYLVNTNHTGVYDLSNCRYSGARFFVLVFDPHSHSLIFVSKIFRKGRESISLDQHFALLSFQWIFKKSVI